MTNEEEIFKYLYRDCVSIVGADLFDSTIEIFENEKDVYILRMSLYFYALYPNFIFFKKKNLAGSITHYFDISKLDKESKDFLIKKYYKINDEE